MNGGSSTNFFWFIKLGICADKIVGFLEEVFYTLLAFAMKIL